MPEEIIEDVNQSNHDMKVSQKEEANPDFAHSSDDKNHVTQSLTTCMFLKTAWNPQLLD